MKKILTTLLLIFTLSLFSGSISAQECDSSEVTRVCYNTTAKVITFEKEGKENKEKKSKLKDNCLEIGESTLTMTNHKGKDDVYEIQGHQLILTENGAAYLIEAKMDGKDYQILLDGQLQYIAIYSVKKSITNWYYMQL